MLVSLTERDHLAYEGSGLERFACALREAGLRVKLRQATQWDVAQLGSSWAKRLGIPERRPAWLLLAECSEDLLDLTHREDQQEQHQRETAGDHQA